MINFLSPAKGCVQSITVAGTADDDIDLEIQIYSHFKDCDESVAMSMIWTMLAQESKKSKPDYSFNKFMWYLQEYCVNYGSLHEDNTFMTSYAFIDGAWKQDPVGSDQYFYHLALEEVKAKISSSS